jgi:glucosamine--fructose-6-phosphate aminotransferase (isomerizing)
VNGERTLRDITGQADGWVAASEATAARAEQLGGLIGRIAPRHVMVTGCGSPYFLAETAAALWQRELAGVAIVTAHPASEVVSCAPSLAPWPAATLMVAISRSGATTEVIEAIDAFRRTGGAAVLGVTCRAASPLAAAADLAVAFDEGFETSIAQTRSFASMVVAVESIASILADRELTDQRALAASCRSALERGRVVVDATTELAAFGRIDVLGSDAHYGLAREAMLKLTELALTPSAAYPFLEYRHGPMSMIDAQSLVVGLLGGSSIAAERDVLDEMAALGATLVTVEPDGVTLASLLPAVQLLAHRRALVTGCDPDHPRHLSAVVQLGTSRAPTGSTPPRPAPRHRTPVPGGDRP